MCVEFGKIASAVVLKSLLSKRDLRKVSPMINDLYYYLNFLDTADRRVYLTLWELTKKEFKRRASSLNLSELAQNHLNTTITGICRNKRRRYLILNNKTGKRKRKKLLSEMRKHEEDYKRKLVEHDNLN